MCKLFYMTVYPTNLTKCHYMQLYCLHMSLFWFPLSLYLTMGGTWECELTCIIIKYWLTQTYHTNGQTSKSIAKIYWIFLCYVTFINNTRLSSFVSNSVLHVFLVEVDFCIFFKVKNGALPLFIGVNQTYLSGKFSPSFNQNRFQKCN